MPMTPAQQEIARAVGARIRSLRANLADRPSQETFAHRVGITFGTLNRIEQGHQNAEWTTLEKIAEKLDVDLQDLLRDALTGGSDARTGYFGHLAADLGRELVATG